MISNYFKIALRNLLKNKAFSLINILGLAIGLSCCMIILLFVHSEWSFDSFNAKGDRIFRVNKVVIEAGKNAEKQAITPGAMAPVLLTDYPEIEHAIRVRPWFNDMLVSYQNTHQKISDVVYADASFFEMFDYQLVQGNKKTVLTEPYTAVVTEETAKLLFGKESPIGKTLVTLYNIPVKVTGVAKDVPENSHLKFKMLISWSTTSSKASADYFSWMNNWITQVLFTYIQVREGTDIKKLDDKIKTQVITKYLPERKEIYFPYLQPLSDIHLGSTDVLFNNEIQLGNRQTVYAMAVIALFILLIACFNFINLTTAGSLRRAKEVGMRKVLGAMRWQLIRQYFSESLLTCVLAFIIALLITQTALPYFNDLTEKHLNFNINVWFVLQVSLLIILVSALAGFYPAIQLTSFQATDAFKDAVKGLKGAFLRKSLVVVQFTLSILLIVGTLVVNRQTDFMLKKKLGFDKDQLIVLPITDTEVEKKVQTFRNQISQYPAITNFSFTNRVPSQGVPGYGIVPEGHTESEHLMAQVLDVDFHFFDTYNIKALQGRTFDERFKTDSNKVVINEAMLRYLGWKDAVGKKFEVIGNKKGEIVGVVKDFHISSAHSKIEPLAMHIRDNPLYLTLKVSADNIPATIKFLEKTWKANDTKNPFEYSFMDERFGKFYKKDLRLLNVLQIFAGLAIFVACLGLLGLVIHTSQQRTKEIGIRKVLGATVTNIVAMLSKDFMKLVLIAAVFAIPVSWWAMSQWLEDFAYRIELGWWIFVLAGALAMVIALATITYQAIRAALMNPVKSLKSE